MTGRRLDESPPSITKGYRIMRKNLKGCKKLAGETLAGNFTVPVIGSIAVAAMSAVSSYISTALFREIPCMRSLEERYSALSFLW